MPHLPPVKAWITKLLPAVPLLSMCMLHAETLTTPRLTCKISQTAGATTITARPKASDEPVVFRIDWIGGQAEGFRSEVSENGTITSTHRFGKTTVTRTILAGGEADCIIIHVVADQPGAVSFNARFISDHPAKILNRREILLSGGKTHAHAWILPFEADVHDNGKDTVSLHGEGEALIILNLTSDPTASPISDTLRRLGRKYDPGHDPPGPHLIREGVFGTEGNGK